MSRQQAPCPMSCHPGPLTDHGVDLGVWPPSIEKDLDGRVGMALAERIGSPRKLPAPWRCEAPRRGRGGLLPTTQTECAHNALLVCLDLLDVGQ